LSSVLTAYEARLAAGDLTPDADQARAAARFDAMARGVIELWRQGRR